MFSSERATSFLHPDPTG